MNVTRWNSDFIGAAGGWQSAGGWTGDTGPSTVPDAIRFDVGGGSPAKAAHAKLTTLVSFTGADGSDPIAALFADAAGDLFGTAVAGSPNLHGTVFEVAKTQDGYASAPTTLVSFTGADGSAPECTLIADAAGDLFGTTEFGGRVGLGTVFEIAKTQGGYASSPTTLANFSGDGYSPTAGLFADAAGDLFGTTGDGGAHYQGMVFEIAKTEGGYADTPTILFSFTGPDGAHPQGSLIADAAGDLFGTTFVGGALGYGTVFEIVKTEGGYADAPTTLVSFIGADGANPLANLIADAAGDLFGTTSNGGADNAGTVFEIAKTQGGYADAPTTLVSFSGADGAHPYGGLIADAAGDLFGTTNNGGIKDQGTVFEIAKTQGGYADAPTTLFFFKRAHGTHPQGSLIADAAGDLFGTTFEGGASRYYGTVFEIKNSGFALPAAAPAPVNQPSPLGAAFVQAMASHGQRGFGGTSPAIFAFPHETRSLLAPPNIA